MNTYGLVGYPLQHSFSGRFFTKKFSDESIDAEYINFEIPQISLLPSIIESKPSLMGLNVTIPYKESVIPYLDDLDAEARAIGAVNVIKFDRSGDRLKLVGYNTDVIGFQHSLSPLLVAGVHIKALVLGTGGASKAVVKGLSNLGIESALVSRRAGKGMYSYQDITENILSKYRVIVNTSPLGTFPNVNECVNIPYQYITNNHLLYDLVYNPEETLFLKKGAVQGALIKNGAEMLQLQAIAAWNVWNPIKL